MNDNQKELKKAYVTLAALKNNLPKDSVEEKYAVIFNSELDRLIKLGFDLEDFKIPIQEISPRLTSFNHLSGEKHYSSKKYVDKEIVLLKLDAVLEYFSISRPENTIGFEP